jgi:type I restriction-modification system DNA methylase subunit
VVLSPLREGSDIKRRLDKTLRPFDAQYNGTLFKEHFVDSLTVGDEALSEVISALYPPQSPYRLDVIDVEILGAAYERYLGSELVRREGRIDLRIKPELRKAEGVYYTPQWVVDEIVRLVVDPLVQGKTVRQLDALRILDPACGSGSFLLAAFARLIRAYETYFTEHPGKRSDNRHRDHYLAADGTRKLGSRAKGEILRRSIFGIDVDSQAVEVTMMSLYLKVLEGETFDSITNDRAVQYELMKAAILPPLEGNIVCGNTLVGSEAYQREFHELDSGELRRLNPLDWRDTGLAGPLSTGGWDAVLGNPPYFSVDATYGRRHPMLAYLRRAYPAVWQDKSDILFYFLAKAVDVARQRAGFIVSRAFFEAYKASSLRRYLADRATLSEVVDFQGFPVFAEAGIATAIVVFDKNPTVSQTRVRRLVTDTPPAQERVVANLRDGAAPFETFEVPAPRTGAAWHFNHQDDRELVERIDAAGRPLSKIATVGQGMQTGDNAAFGGLTWEAVRRLGIPEHLIARRIRNSDIRRGYVTVRDEWLLYLEDVLVFDLLPSSVRDHLNAHRDQLMQRAAYKRGNCEWWKYTWPLHKEAYVEPRLLCPYRASFNRFAPVDGRGAISLTDSTVVFPMDATVMKVLLGILNSRLLTFRYRRLGKLTGNNMWEYFWNGVGMLPIALPDSNDTMFADIERLVDEKDANRAMLHGAPNGSVDSVIAVRRLAETDRQLDDVVLGLYGITNLADRAAVQDIALDDM